MNAAALDSVEDVRKLLTFARYVRSSDGMTPLHCASELGAIGATRVLMKKVGQDGVRQKDRGGYTAMHLAAANGHLNTVKALIRGGKYILVAWNGLSVVYSRCNIVIS